MAKVYNFEKEVLTMINNYYHNCKKRDDKYYRLSEIATDQDYLNSVNSQKKKRKRFTGLYLAAKNGEVIPKTERKVYKKAA